MINWNRNNGLLFLVHMLVDYFEKIRADNTDYNNGCNRNIGKYSNLLNQLKQNGNEKSE